MHAALRKRDPKTYRHMYIWIQIYLKREFDRISEDSTAEVLTRTEDIDSTLKMVDTQIKHIFSVAEKMKAGEIQPNKQYQIANRANLIIERTEKLRVLIDEKASESPDSSPTNNFEEDQQVRFSP